MNNCTQCGISIPKGQSICSMCMGDINHGTDNYYREWVESEERKYLEQQIAWEEDRDQNEMRDENE